MSLPEAAELLIRVMTETELSLAVDWAAAEGWNPGLNDAPAFYAADPGGYLAGVYADEVVASVSAVSYGPHYGFLGFLVVKPGLRGYGLGRKIGLAAMAHLDDGRRVLGCDGVAAMQARYAREGFRPAFLSRRRQAAGGGRAPEGLIRLGRKDLPAVAALDDACFPAPRPAFLERWITLPGHLALGAPDAGGLAGYGVLRPCRNGYKIGPLFARAPEAAEALLTGLLAAAEPGQPVFWDVPDINPDAVALAAKRGYPEVFACARMYKNGAPPWRDRQVFGITSFELG